MPVLLISSRGKRLRYTVVQPIFRKLLHHCGIAPRSAACRPRIHDLRHSFAVSTIVDDYRTGDPGSRLAILPFLKASGRGRVVNISSQAGVVAIDEHAVYGSSKAGLILLTKVLALEWARFGITVNAIAPTVVETPMALVGWSGEKGVQARKEIPVGRFAMPAEIAAAAEYLSSADAGIISGETLMADGGFTIR